jgi:hypothetical protein
MHYFLIFYPNNFLTSFYAMMILVEYSLLFISKATAVLFFFLCSSVLLFMLSVLMGKTILNDSFILEKAKRRELLLTALRMQK